MIVAKFAFMKEYIKHLLIRTPLEKPAYKIQHLFEYRERQKHPELHEIYMESQRIGQFIERVVSESSNCLDIGAHLGSMLSEIIKIAPGGHHIAFEAIPYKAHWLKQKFPEVEVKQVALSDTTGETTFYINKSRSGFSGLQQHNVKQNDRVLQIDVTCDRLDNILAPDYRVDFIKIDVEGAELAAFMGAEKTLRRDRPILLFECTRSALSGHGITPEQIFEFLTKNHSYSIFLLKDFLEEREPLNLERFQQALVYPFQAFNFVAIAKH
jgi:FkbM family methyltransferase